MKKEYERVKMEVVALETDIITESNPRYNDDENANNELPILPI